MLFAKGTLDLYKLISFEFKTCPGYISNPFLFTGQLLQRPENSGLRQL